MKYIGYITLAFVLVVLLLNDSRIFNALGALVILSEILVHWRLVVKVFVKGGLD